MRNGQNKQKEAGICPFKKNKVAHLLLYTSLNRQAHQSDLSTFYVGIGYTYVSLYLQGFICRHWVHKCQSLPTGLHM